jgi:pimeloyl-ACP methyl ester carboxylesterase
MPYADVNGQRLFHEEAGSGEPAIIWSHGLFMDRTMFAPQVEAFGDAHRCVTWDERGHGRTEATGDAFTYWDSAKDLVGLMDHLGIERAVLAGMSQGGYLSLRAALADPGRVLGLILLDTQAATEDRDKLAAYDQLLAAWTGADELPDEIAEVVRAIILGGYDRGDEWQAKWKAMDRDRVRQAYGALVSREHLEDRLGEIDVPALVVHAEDDAAIEVAAARRMAELLPQGELVVVATGGHAANLVNPREVNPHIARFLAALRQGAAA